MKSKKILCCMLAAVMTAGTVTGVTVSALADENADIPAASESLITADTVSFEWDRSNETGIIIQTDSQSKEIALRKDGKLLATSVMNKNLSVEDGQIYIGAPLLNKLDDGENDLVIVLKEGTLEISVTVTEEWVEEPSEEEFEIIADSVEFTWDRNDFMGIMIQTNSQSKQIALRKNGRLAATSVTSRNLFVEDGFVYIGTDLLDKLDDGENYLSIVLKEGTLDITVTVTDEYTEEPSDEETELTADNISFTWDRSNETGITVQTNSQSKEIALRTENKLLATSLINKNLLVEDGQIYIGTALLSKLDNGENNLVIVLKEGKLGITVNVTGEPSENPANEEKVITAKTVDFTWDRSDLIGIAVYTNSKSKSVAISKNGDILASSEDKGLYITLGRVGITSKILRNLDNGENQLTLILDDGVLEINVNVTDKKNRSSEENEITADNVNFTWDRSDSMGISVHTNSTSETLAIRKDGKIFAGSDGKNLFITDGTVGMTAELLSKLDNGANDLKLIFDDGTLDITVTVTDRANISGTNNSTTTRNNGSANTDYNYGDSVPNTGSHTAVAVTALAVLSAGAVGILSVFKKKKNSDNV